jgi:GNAT superfamily N-acetyltransferase
MFSGLLRVPRQSTVAVVDGNVVGVCIASRGQVAGANNPPGGSGLAGGSGFVDLVAVDPTWQGQGVGAQLLAHAEAQFAESGCAQAHAAGNAPFYAWPGVDARYTRAIGLFEDRGYRRRGVEMTMSVHLAAAPLDTGKDEKRLVGRGITFRSARADEGPGLREALAAAWKPEWLDELDEACRQPYGGVEMAIGPKGYAGFCAFGVNRPSEVGPLGTDPQYRGQGIGTVLIRRALRAVAAEGHRTGELPWAGPLSLFARNLDATVSRVFIRYTKQLA